MYEDLLEEIDELPDLVFGVGIQGIFDQFNEDDATELWREVNE